MNASSVSNCIEVFSKDVLLKRQARSYGRNTATTQPNPNLSPLHSLKRKPLHIILEEDESHLSSSSRSPSPYSRSISPGSNQTMALKTKRRHANLTVADIKIARDATVHIDNDIPEYDTLLSAPRPAPRPPTAPSPSSSPDSFNLKFTDLSLSFPHPPIPTPTSLKSRDLFTCASPTPSMSSSSSSPSSATAGLPSTPSSSDDEFSLPSPTFNPRRVAIRPLSIVKHSSFAASPSFEDPFLSPSKKAQPFFSYASSDESSYESELESDSEWYSREFSNILTLYSDLPPDASQNARPESMSLLALDDASPVQQTPNSALRPSADTFESRSNRRRSRSYRVPSYAPPPVPQIPAHLRTSSQESNKVTSIPPPLVFNPPSCPKTIPVTYTRPPPRSSIPADCAYYDDNSSIFSLSLYDSVESPISAYSQASFQKSQDFDLVEFPEDVEFDLDIDHPMMLPLSLPSSPIDLEADIANGLNELWMRNRSPRALTGFMINDCERNTPSPQSQDPSSTSSTTTDTPEKGLKSKWSSDTLGSVRDQHARRGASSMLKLYFGNSPLKSKRGSSTSSRKMPTTPTSPMKRMGRASATRESELIGYAPQGAGLRRRGSMTPTVSDAGSEDSSSSTSSGLRRKPIPVEMFIRA